MACAWLENFSAKVKGDEIADYSYNYVISGSGAGSDVKNVSVNYYNRSGTSARASQADTEDPIEVSEGDEESVDEVE